MLIGHAVSMAIGGTTLMGQAEQAGRMETPGQAGSQGNRAQAAAAAPGQPESGAGGDPSQQLMVHARKQIQDSRRLLEGAGRDPGSARPLYAAANDYINTLLALSGESSTQDAGAARTGNAA